MTDSFTNEPIRVSTDGDGGPYIIVQLDQLERVTKILSEAGYHFQVDEEALSLNDQPFSSIIELGPKADVGAIQKMLDRAEDPAAARKWRPRSGRHG